MARRQSKVVVLAAVAALVAAAFSVVAVPAPAGALPDVCSSGAANVHVADPGFEGDWDDSTGWTNGVPDGPNEIACIDSSGHVLLDGFETPRTVTLRALYLDGALTVAYSSLFVNGPEESVLALDSVLHLDHGTFGGVALVTGHGVVDAANDSSLSSGPATTGAAWTGPLGTLDVASDGYLQVRNGRLALLTRYGLGISGFAELQGNGFVTADFGTATTIGEGGTLLLTNDGGYYQGSPVPGQTAGTLVNSGLIEKDDPSTTALIDAAYTQTASGAVHVAGGTLLFAGPQLVSGTVEPTMTLGTGACGAGTQALCGGSVDPAVDPSSATFQVSANDGNPAAVQVQELAKPVATTDSRALGNDVYAHADGLVTDPAQPATITLRFSQADVMSTPLADVQVAHISDAGVMTKAPDCAGAGLPSGAAYCVVRPVTRTAQNTFVTVRTLQTSRWRLRRTGPNESFDQSHPTAPQEVTVGLAAPYDGSAVKVGWSPPADDGGAATTAYRVYRDGRLLSSTPATSSAVVVTDSGPGTHAFAVSAVNALGESTGATVSVAIAKLSKPRKVKAIPGGRGGKTTAGAKWKAPAAAGGYAITRYKVAVFGANGKKVATKLVKASRHRYLFKLAPGRYFFKVRARNADTWGPWSKKTSLVRPR